MKKVFYFFLIILLGNSEKIVFSQTGNSPYPVIFVHGLNSDNTTWNSVITQLSSSWNLNSNHVLHFVMNARGGDTTDYVHDVIIPQIDINGNVVNRIEPSSIYAVNFGNFWNRNISDPRLMLYNNSTPGGSQSPSNQSAIYKQGLALKIMIDSVLRVNNVEKVILAGHSMGGLAIREYLQRTENGLRKWWINPGDSINGHKVARVVTIGTPHLGTNITSIPLFTIDNNSEAMRDMKISFGSNIPGAYLFGNSEVNVPSSYYNADVNCNGSVTDIIEGLDYLTYDNPEQKLPVNIFYSWITSNYLGLGTDLAVPFANQRLFVDLNAAPVGSADTIRTNRNHINETNDNRSLIRGLDEPDKRAFAYGIKSGVTYSGFITLKSGTITSDTDYYNFKISASGKIKTFITSVNAGVTGISLLNESGSLLISKNLTSSSDSLEFTGETGDYFIRVTGNSNSNPNQNSYRLKNEFTSSPVLNLTAALEGMWNGIHHVNDTVRIILRESVSPYNAADSVSTILDSAGNVLTQFNFEINGNYYIQLLHRNALETWSYTAIQFMPDLITQLDFTSSQSNAFGDNQKFKSGKWCIYSGDVNSDGIIEGSDVSMTGNDAENFVTGYTDTDVTGDGFVDAADVSIADNNAAEFVVKITP